MTKIVRTPTKATGGITDAERDAMKKHADLWISRAMRTTPVDVDEITSAVHDLYAAAGLKQPRVVVVPSPLVMAFSYGASAAILWNLKSDNAAHNAVDNAVHNAVSNAVRNATDNAVGRAVRNAVRNATDDAVGNAVGNAVDNAVDDAVGRAVRNAVHNAVDDAVRNAVGSAVHNAVRNATDDAVGNAVGNAVDNAVDDAVGNAVHNAVSNAVRNATDNAVGSAVHNAVRNAVGSAVHNAVRNAVDDAADACRDLAGALGLACSKRWYFNYQGGTSWSAYDSYLTAMRDIIGLRLPAYEKYAAWERCAIAAPFRVLHEEFCIVSDFPEVLKVDDENRPHCETGPSHRWRDGWALYHWHGVSIPAEWIEFKQNLTARTALTLPNIEQRRAACEIIGWDRILSELKARIIDEDDDPQVGTLVEVSLPDAGKERFLRVVCGTGRKFALPVPRTVKSAVEAQAWTWGLDTSEFKKPEIRT